MHFTCLHSAHSALHDPKCKYEESARRSQMERNTGHTDGRCENIDVEGAVSFSVNIRKDEKKKKKKKN